jgi:hypothetical protein
MTESVAFKNYVWDVKARCVSQLISGKTLQVVKGPTHYDLHDRPQAAAAKAWEQIVPFSTKRLGA